MYLFRWGLLVALVPLTFVSAAAPPMLLERLPPWQRVLQGVAASEAEKLEKQLDKLQSEQKWAEAERRAEELWQLRRRLQGQDHWETILAHFQKTALARVRTAAEPRQKAYAEALKMAERANQQEARGQYAATLPLREQLLQVATEVLGSEHPYTASNRINLAINLYWQGRHTEAEKHYRAALASHRKTLGEEHPYTARALGGLALNLHAQGNYAEAEQTCRLALAQSRKVLGEDHSDVATLYNNLALAQHAQAKYAAAQQGYLRALQFARQFLGEEAPATAVAYNNLAQNHFAQGNYPAAEQGYQRALSILRKLAPAEHPFVIGAFAGLTRTQHALGKYTEAEKNGEAVVTLFRKSLGEGHPQTATAYHNLALTQSLLGKYREAESNYRKGLESYTHTFGPTHPSTATAYHNLAANAHVRGDRPLALELASKAAESFERARLRIAVSGLERSTLSGNLSPFPLLAVLLAQEGKAVQAWQRFEQSLARGTADELAARLKYTDQERREQQRLVQQLRPLEARLQELASRPPASEAQQKQRGELLAQILRVETDLARLVRDLERKYGPAQGQILDLATVQAALPKRAAYLAWLDTESRPGVPVEREQHWAVVVKATGDPQWIRIPGSGPQGTWTQKDGELPGQLLDAILRQGDWQALAHRLREQRLGPLTEALRGTDQIILLPSGMMDTVPVEIIADNYTVSYALSASLFAHLRSQPAPSPSGLLALGDPVFDGKRESELPLPPGGLLLTKVVPGRPAAAAGLRAGDVLLDYAGLPLNTPDDLQKRTRLDKPAEVSYWRLDPRTARAALVRTQLAAGQPGVEVAQEPAPQALKKQREVDLLLAMRDETSWSPLPGTRSEVVALQRLFAEEKPIVLLGSEASETRLAQLVASEQISRVRYVHLATHGQARFDRPLASRIILSRQRLEQGQSGDLSAEQILTDWRLNAELVTLSACQTGLGPYSRGEGFVGFAQAILLAGSRSVCLSRWSVNDLSTALLMERFYQNLRGKRPGLKRPLSKAAALWEAKQWLRQLSREEAEQRVKALWRDQVRGKGAKELKLLPGKPSDERPYAHPYYWAGFVLVGECN